MPERTELLSTTRLAWVGSAVVGASSGLSVANHLLGIWTRTTPQKVLILLFLTLLFSLSAYRLIFRFARRRLASFSPRTRAVWVLLCFLIGAILLVVVPVEPQLPPTRHHLEIVATGDTNPRSQASEVWILEIQQPDGSTLSLDDLALSGDWEVRDGALLSYQNQPASAQWTGLTTEGHFAVTFVSHPWSGVVEVQLDGNQQRLDLYAATDTQIPVALPATYGAGRGLDRVILPAALYGADLVTLAGLVLVASVWVVTRGAGQEGRAEVPRWSWVYYALPCASVWTLWLLIFWPGLMSPDSIDQWGQMLSGNLVDWHPAFHTLTNWLITRLWLSPATVALAQIAALSCVVGWGLARIRRLGTPPSVVWASCALFSLSPVNGTMVITLWKDIPYSIAMLALTVLVLEVVSSDGAWLARGKRWALLGVVGALVALYRHNGPVAGFGTVLLLIGVYRQEWRPLLAALALTVGLWLGARGPLYEVVGVNRSSHPGLRWVVAHHLVAHVANDTPQTEYESAVLNELYPLSNEWRYDCETIQTIAFDNDFSSDFLETDFDKLGRVAWSLALRRPQVDLTHIACNSSLVWRIRRLPGGHQIATQLRVDGDGNVITIEPNDFGLRLQALLPVLASPVAESLVDSQQSSVSWALWRSPLYLYVGLAAVTIGAVRTMRWRYVLVMVPVMLHSFLLACAAPAQDLRFQYPVYLAALLLGQSVCLGAPLTGDGVATMGEVHEA